MNIHLGFWKSFLFIIGISTLHVSCATVSETTDSTIPVERQTSWDFTTALAPVYPYLAEYIVERYDLAEKKV